MIIGAQSIQTDRWQKRIFGYFWIYSFLVETGKIQPYIEEHYLKASVLIWNFQRIYAIVVLWADRGVFFGGLILTCYIQIFVSYVFWNLFWLAIWVALQIPFGEMDWLMDSRPERGQLWSKPDKSNSSIGPKYFLNNPHFDNAYVFWTVFLQPSFKNMSLGDISRCKQAVGGRHALNF